MLRHLPCENTRSRCGRGFEVRTFRPGRRAGRGGRERPPGAGGTAGPACPPRSLILNWPELRGRVNVDQKKVQAIAAVVAVVLLVGIWLFNRQEQPPQNPTPADESPHLVMGNPSGATTDPAKPDDYLMRKPYFALSYNDGKGTPNWVSWRLQESDLGPAPRSEFFPDPDLPQGFRRVRPADYTGSGFDRGHM